MARNPLFVMSVSFFLPWFLLSRQNPKTLLLLKFCHQPPSQDGWPEEQTSTALAIFATSASQNLLRLWGLKENPSNGRSQRATYCS